MVRVLGQHPTFQNPAPIRRLPKPPLHDVAPVFRNVLIADSGKGHVEEMVRMLRDIPTVRQARFNLLHVVPEQAGASFTEHSQEAAAIAAEAVLRLGLNPGEVTTIIRQGDTKQTVLKVADELNSDLIVMGSRGMNRLQAILSNSASQYVFQLSTRPMLLVRDDLYIRHINRVMVPIDGTGVGDNALKLACELVRDIPGGSLTGVHVSRQEIAPSRGGKSPADEVLAKAAQRARGFGVELTTVQRSGDVGRTVCAAAEELKADLLVIASQDRRPVVARGLVDIDRLLGSSVSDFIRVHAPAPVLLVREPESRR
jgi:nucleotide-binding universal stress UspA family protein